MAYFDEFTQTLNVKLVYYGPAASGKTTNLMRLHDILHPAMKGAMKALETRDDRTLFFEVLPLGITTPSGLKLRIKIFTVPGQVMHDSTRKALLSRADGVVFVADSQKTQSITNAEAFENLLTNARHVGLDLNAIPLIIEFNKRDLSNIRPEEEILRRWSKTPWPVMFSSALQGYGVLPVFRELLKKTYRMLNDKHDLTHEYHLDLANFTAQVIGESNNNAMRGTHP